MLTFSVMILSKPLIEATNDKEVRVIINCNTTYQNKTAVLLNVSLDAKNLKIMNVSVPCSKDESAYFHGLTCGQNYFVSVFWFHSDENQYHLHPCALAQNISYTHKHKKCSGIIIIIL